MIKTKQIKTAKATILVIGGLPEDADEIEIPREETLYFYQGVIMNSIKIPPGKWESVGFLDKITEGVAKGLVNRFYDFDMIPGYSDDKMIWRKATEALRSLVAANCELENQYGDYPKEDQARDEIQYYHLCEDWQAEEEKVFRNPYLLLLIK